MEVESLAVCGNRDIGSFGCIAREERSDVCSKGLKWICRLCVVIRKEEVAYSIIQRIVETSFTLEGVSFAKSPILEKEPYHFVMTT